MPRQIFVNLPVRDLQRSKDFFASLGFAFDPKFTDEKAACMIVGENIYTMLLKEEFFKTFIDRPLADARKETGVLVCISCDSRAQVDETVAKATKAGGKPHGKPQDHGFMYQHGYQDLDGHLWELVYMVPGAEGPH